MHFLHGPRLDARDAGRLRDLVSAGGGALTLHEVTDERLAALPSDSRFTSAMWHRFFLPDLLPDVARVLYLDADTLACGSLEPLWRTDLAGHTVAAVTNAFQPNHRRRVARLGLDRTTYFNSGVLLLDLERMRRDDTTGALVRLVAERGDEFEWPDQDALNLVLAGSRLPLAPRWNATNALSRRWSMGTFGPAAHLRALLRPRIRHFEGPDANKPWHPDCAERDRERYGHHLARTPWGAN